MQRWRSGRTRTIRNRVMQECIQGFKSLSLRQFSPILEVFTTKSGFIVLFFTKFSDKIGAFFRFFGYFWGTNSIFQLLPLFVKVFQIVRVVRVGISLFQLAVSFLFAFTDRVSHK